MRNRTADILITSEVLYRLSYGGSRMNERVQYSCFLRGCPLIFADDQRCRRPETRELDSADTRNEQPATSIPALRDLRCATTSNTRICHEIT